MAEPAALPRRSPLSGVARSGRHGAAPAAEPGVTIAIRHNLSIATVIARKGRAQAASEAAKQAFACALPEPGKSNAGQSVLFLWAGPEQWLAMAEDEAEGALLTKLQEAFGETASAADQSHGRAVIRVSGPRVRDLLAKGCALDLHPSRFQTGDCAQVQIAHIGVHLHQSGDEPSYELQMFRGFAVSFWEWLTDSAAEYGYEVYPQGL
jgi:heterotetrameric sarcosine oxidase gamma subunit